MPGKKKKGVSSASKKESTGASDSHDDLLYIVEYRVGMRNDTFSDEKKMAEVNDMVLNAVGKFCIENRNVSLETSAKVEQRDRVRLY